MPLFRVLLLSALAAAAFAQPDARLRGGAAAELYDGIAELMEANRIVIPELARAGAPLVENFRQGAATLAAGPRADHVGVLYRMLTNARVYLQVLDALPRPEEFSADVGDQIDRLRKRVEKLERHFRATLDFREQQALGADRDNLRRYAQQNRIVGPLREGEQRVVFLGDSITDGWKLNQYFPAKPYINRGISGQISGQMLGRMKADVLDLKPRAAVVLAGTNDLARGVADGAIRNNLETIGLLAEAAGIVPVFASILPVSDYHQEGNPRYKRTPLRNPERILALNRWLAQICRERGWPYIDYFGALVDDAGRLRKEMADDGLHPNAEGYKVMAPLAQKAIDAALAPADRQSKRRLPWWGKQQ